MADETAPASSQPQQAQQLACGHAFTERFPPICRGCRALLCWPCFELRGCTACGWSLATDEARLRQEVADAEQRLAAARMALAAHLNQQVMARPRRT